jgi:D-serine deaminase-like pyridoxal phosphate-dependent protein
MWYKPVNESSIATPCILLYPDRIEENIRRMIRISGDAARLRPHVKTHKIAEVTELQLKQGIQRFKCATLSEVAMVARAGGRDILLAYPLLGPGIGQWFQLMDLFPESRLSVTVDSAAALKELEDFAQEKEKQVDVFVDVDNGMHRTGIHPEGAFGLIQSIEKKRNFRFRGLHVYDGHIHETDPQERKDHCDRDFEAVGTLIERLEQVGIFVEELACGGTPTFPIHAGHLSRTLCPGTPLLWDAGYGRNYPDLDFLPAAVVAGRIISRQDNQLTLDLGYKAIASEMNHPRILFLELLDGGVINHSEEHLVVKCSNEKQSSIGQVVYALPFHICPTMALHEQVYVVRQKHVSDTWEVVARKRNYPL